MDFKTKELRAVKIIDKEQLGKENWSFIKNEIAILSELDHPNIVKIYEFFENHQFFYIVMELVKGRPLFRKIKEICGREDKSAGILYQVLRTLNYIHQKGIVHMDIKAENILYADGEVKVIDFGLSTFFDSNKKMNKQIGTKLYFAPEIIRKSYTFKCDIWSAGVILFALLTGKMPFDGDTDQTIFNNILNMNFKYNISKDKRVSEEAKELIDLMLTFDQEKRPPANALLSHRFFNKRPKVEMAGSNLRVLQNLNRFQIKNKLQERIFYYFVHHMVTRKEHEKFGKVFRTLDKDGDGELSRSELEEGFKKLGKNLPAEEVDRIFNLIDVDGDGSISYTEYVAAAFDKTEFLKETRLRRFFDILDSDKSGSITLTDFTGIIGQSSNFSEREMGNIFRKYDVNHDNKMDFQEFKVMMGQLVPGNKKKKKKKRGSDRKITRDSKKRGSDKKVTRDSMKKGSERKVLRDSRTKPSGYGRRSSQNSTRKVINSNPHSRRRLSVV